MLFRSNCYYCDIKSLCITLFLCTSQTYRVYDAGLDFVNGRYVLAQSRCDKEGYIIPGIDVCYEKIDRVTGKKMVITLDKSSNDGQDNATWFLSEEHKVDEPGVKMEYSDYYTASGSFKYPPLDSWVSLYLAASFTCILLH